MVYYDKEFIAKKIRLARLNANLTQEQLAEKIDISIQQISRLEVGMYVPSLPTFLNIVKVLNLSLKDFGIYNTKKDNKTLDDIIKILHTFNDVELECCYNSIQTLNKNFNLIKNSGKGR